MPSHTWFMGCMTFVAHTSKTRADTVPIVVSAFSRCPHKCIVEHSEGHNGTAGTQNTNLSALASETMWSQPIMVELLTVLLLSPAHMHSVPSLPLVISHWEHVWRVRESIFIYYTGMCVGFDEMANKKWSSLNVFRKQKYGLRTCFKNCLRTSMNTLQWHSTPPSDLCWS